MMVGRYLFFCNSVRGIYMITRLELFVFNWLIISNAQD